MNNKVGLFAALGDCESRLPCIPTRQHRPHPHSTGFRNEYCAVTHCTIRQAAASAKRPAPAGTRAKDTRSSQVTTSLYMTCISIYTCTCTTSNRKFGPIAWTAAAHGRPSTCGENEALRFEASFKLKSVLTTPNHKLIGS